MSEDHRQQIIDRWKAAFGQYDALKADAEPAVVRWEWTAGGERYSPLPFYFQRFDGRARALKEPPSSKAGYLEYGLDHDGRPRVARRYSSDEEAFETFYHYDDGLIEVVEFSTPPRIPLRVEQIFLEQNRVTRHTSFQMDWAFLNWYFPLESEQSNDPDTIDHVLDPNGRIIHLENYLYEGERLVRIFSHYKNPNGSGVPSHQVEERLTYDEAGKLKRIEWAFSNGVTEVAYQKRAKGETFQSIRAAAVEKMIEAIIERLRTARITEKLYCIELVYQAGEHHFPPSIVLGLESRRQEILASTDSDTHCAMFAPIMNARPDNGLWIEITDPDTLVHCQRLEQEIAVGEKWTTATRILRDIAAALTQYDWTGILDVTPDFVVFAIDHEMDDLEAALRASASKEQIREWKKKGWL
jgi:hypothetical protein